MNSKAKSMRLVATPRRPLRSKPTPRPSELIRAEVDKINMGLTELSKPRIVSLSESDDDRLLIDCDEETKSSVDDFEDDVIGSEDSELKRVKRERVRNWWAKNFSEKMGDPSKVVEVILEDDNNEEFEVISPKNKRQTVEEVIESTDDLFQRLEMKTSVKKSPQDHMRQNQKLRELDLFMKKKSQEHLKRDIICSKGLTESQTVITKIKTSELFCFLCPEVFKDSESAKLHYLSHLGVFLECGECHQKFASIQSYRKHNSQHLERNKMLYLDDFMNAKKWSDHYVDYIERHEELIQQFCRTNKMFCPVCRQMRQLFDDIETNCKMFGKPMKSSKTKFNDEFVRNHLHQHFQYFPYECIDCRFEDKRTEFCLNRTARQHLLDVHKVETAFDLKLNELKTYFDLKKSIKRLDFNIDYCLSLSMKMNDFWEKSRQKCDQTKIFSTKSQ